ncbi:MAG: type I 3-dehydroquinate dehydratase [Candidatus Gracilibacteria bacterium]
MICIPIQASALTELQQKLKKVPSQADLVEVWIDYLPLTIDAKKVVAASKKPLLIVNKPKREKGQWTGTEQARIDRLKQFAQANAKYIDIGIDTDVMLIKDLVRGKKRSKIIVSYHNFERTPSTKTLEKIVKKGFRLGADIVKIATFAQKTEDNMTLLNLLKSNKPLAVMCMGEKGKVSRIAGQMLGSQLTFVAAENQNKTAPGQLTLKEYQTIESIIKSGFSGKKSLRFLGFKP